MDRNRNAVDFIQRHGTTEGKRHKAWVLDQALRILMTQREYDRFRLADLDWDEGIAP